MTVGRHARILRRPGRAFSAASVRSSKFLKVVLSTLVLFAGISTSALHAQSHFPAADSQLQLVEGSASFVNILHQDHSEDRRMPIGGFDHHLCACSFVQDFSARSSFEVVYLKGAHVRYPGYLDELAPKFEPAPLRKPPRVTVSA